MSADGGYGIHPTSHSGKSDLGLYAQLRHESWEKLSEAERLEVLQEVVNRSALSHGELGSCKVEFANLDPQTAGEQRGDTIYLNREMFVNDRQLATYNGSTIERPLEDANIRALVTVLHEDEHAYQNQVIGGLIPAADLKAAREYIANDFAAVLVQDSNGQYRLGSTYLRGETPGALGYSLYYLQATERDAHLLSEMKAEQIVNALEAQYGTERSFDAFRAELQANGYSAVLKEAQSLTGEQNVEREINQCLANHYYGTNTKVSPAIESLVSDEMALSYDAMSQGKPMQQDQRIEGEGVQGKIIPAGLCNSPAQEPPASVSTSQEQAGSSGSTTSSVGGNKLNIDWHVTYEEYDQTLRDGVNAYYEHAMHDPTMSHEEAISSTSQMAEGYLQASEVFALEPDGAELDSGDIGMAEDSGGIDSSTSGIGEDDGGLDGLGDDDGGIDW